MAATVTLPEGVVSFFGTVKWDRLEEKESVIDVPALIEVGSSLPALFDILGFSFKPCKKDVEGNLRKLTNSYNSNKEGRNDVESLLISEQDSQDNKNDASGTVGVLWFKRTIEFIYVLLSKFLELRSSGENVSECVRLAYDSTLKAHHTWIMQKTFAMVSYASPKRTGLESKFSYGNSGCENQMYQEMEQFLAHVRPLLEKLNALLISNKLEEEDKALKV